MRRGFPVRPLAGRLSSPATCPSMIAPARRSNVNGLSPAFHDAVMRYLPEAKQKVVGVVAEALLITVWTLLAGVTGTPVQVVGRGEVGGNAALVTIQTAATNAAIPTTAAMRRLRPLPARLRQVQTLAREGFTVAETARALGISVNTVKVYRASLLRRGGFLNRARRLSPGHARQDVSLGVAR